jgi:HK97 family phage major capsid protein
VAPKTIIPQSANELQEMLNDKRTMATLADDPTAFAEFIESYKTVSLKNDPGIVAQVKEQTEAFMVDWLKGQSKDEINSTAKRLNLDNPFAKRAYQQNALYNKRAPGAALDADNSFESFSDMMYNLSDKAYKTPELSNKLRAMKNALDPVKPSDGGFLIPEIHRAEILRIALEKAFVRRYARVIPMDGPTVHFPSIDSTSNVSSVYGGVVGYWTEPGATLTETSPKFGRVTLESHKLTLYTECPNELLQDSRPAMDAFLNLIFPEALGWFENMAFTIGQGTGEPLGFQYAPCVVKSTRAGAGHIAWADCVNMYSRMLPSSLDSAIWVASPDTLPDLLTMTVTATSGAVMLGGGAPQSAGTVTPPLSILGRPIVVSEQVSKLGTSGDLQFVDLGYYLLGDQQAMSAKQSEDFRFNEDVTAFRVTERVDGRPWLKKPITPANGSTATLSPMVQLT